MSLVGCRREGMYFKIGKETYLETGGLCLGKVGKVKEKVKEKI